VAPEAVTAIGQTSATIRGTVDPNGSATTYQFDWGLTSALGNVTPATAASAGSGTAAVGESAHLTGLSPDTTYYYELRASNGSGSSTTPVESFKTGGNPAPTSTTDAAAGVGRYAATLVGTVNPANQTTTYYFQYGLTDSYGFQTNVESVAAGSAPVTVTASLPGLEPGTVFHYRLVASHGSTSTTDGNDVAFQTAPFPRPQTRITFGVTAGNNRRFVAGGKIELPYTTPSSFGCQGTMRIRYYRGARLLVTRFVPVDLHCTYGETTRIASVPAGASLIVRARYLGDLYDGASAIRQVTVAAR
jgi:hypothetical protein